MRILNTNDLSQYTNGKETIEYINLKYPNYSDMDRLSYSVLVEYLASGEYKGNQVLANYSKERRAEAIITAWGTAYLQALARNEAAGLFNAEKALAFLEEFYFVDEDQAIIRLMSELPGVVAGRITLLLLKYRENVSELIDTVGSFLSKKSTTGALRAAYREFVPRVIPKYQN